MLGRLLCMLVSTALACDCVLAQPAGGETIAFQSPDATGVTTALRGMLWRSQGPAKGAVVILHGSGGWSDHREGHYARALSDAGYTALAIDSYGARGIGQTTEDQSQISGLQLIRDVYAARRFLIDSGIARDRLAVMGFSRGAWAAYSAMDRTFLPAQQDRFQVALSFYPGCTTRSQSPKPTGEIFMALGERDDYTGVKPCQQMAQGFSDAGGQVTVKIYEDATHAFDGNPANTGMIRLHFVENYMDCVVTVNEKGRAVYVGKEFELENPVEIFSELKRTCVKKGATIWTNPRQKQAATRDAIQFLDSRLK